MSKGQKTIILIEIVLIVVGGIILLFVPQKTMDLSPYFKEFSKYDSDFNLLSGIQYNVVKQKIDQLTILHNNIKKVFAANDPKTDINNLMQNITQYKELIKDINNDIKIYKNAMSKFEEAFNKIQKITKKYAPTIAKSKELQLKISSSKSTINNYLQQAKLAKSTNEILTIQKKLIEQLGIIDSFELLIQKEKEKLKREALLAKKKKVVKKKPVPVKKKIAPKKSQSNINSVVETKVQAITITPPVLIKRVMPDYPERFQQMGIGGKVKLELTIDKNGKVKKVRFLISTNNDTLDYNALQAAKQCLFKPAMKGNTPTEGKYILKYEFK